MAFMIWPSSMFFRSIFSAAIVFFYQASLAGQNGYYLFSIDSENTRNGHGLVGSKSRPASVAVKVSPFDAQVTRPIGNFDFCRSTSWRRDVWVCPEFRVWLPSAARFLDGSFGRTVRIQHLPLTAAAIDELPLLRRPTGEESFLNALRLYWRQVFLERDRKNSNRLISRFFVKLSNKKPCRSLWHNGLLSRSKLRKSQLELRTRALPEISLDSIMSI
ncbi:hypothetical protein [Azonexus sp.]|uniref:hypothetical protein n=1 Tax=Azonexus sp. TaxID=1872668 RepID=UPI0035B04BA1